MSPLMPANAVVTAQMRRPLSLHRITTPTPSQRRQLPVIVLLALCAVLLALPCDGQSIFQCTAPSAVLYSTPYVLGLSAGAFSDGSIYALDRNGIRAMRINGSTGAVITSYITRPSLIRPESVTVGANGDVWVMDSTSADRDRVVRFSNAGTQLSDSRWYNMTGQSVQSIAAGQSQWLYQSAYSIARGYHIIKRSQVDDQPHSIVNRSACANSTRGQPGTPLAVDGSGRLYWSYTNGGDTCFLCRLETDGGFTALPGPISSCEVNAALAIDPSGSFAFQATSDVGFRRTQLNSTDPPGYVYVNVQSPVAVAMNSNAHTYVTDGRNILYTDIQPTRWDVSLQFNISSLSPASTGAFFNPKRAVTDSYGNVYAIDLDSKVRVGEWNTIVRISGQMGAVIGHINTSFIPNGGSSDDDWTLQIDTQDRLFYFPQQGQDEFIRVFATDGRLLHAINCSDIAGSRWQRPRALYVDRSDDSIFIVTSAYDILYQLDSNFVQRARWNITAVDVGLLRPVVVDQARALLYVQGTYGGPVSRFDIGQWKLLPGDNSQPQLLGSVDANRGLESCDLAIDRAGYVYVMGTGNKIMRPRMQVFDWNLALVANYTAPNDLNYIWNGIWTSSDGESVLVLDVGGIMTFPTYHSNQTDSTSSSSSSTGGMLFSSSEHSSSSLPASVSSSAPTLGPSAPASPTSDSSASSFSSTPHPSSSSSSEHADPTSSVPEMSSSSSSSGGGSSGGSSQSDSSDSSVSPVVVGVVVVVVLVAVVVVTLLAWWRCCPGSSLCCCRVKSGTSTAAEGGGRVMSRQLLLDVDGYQTEMSGRHT